MDFGGAAAASDTVAATVRSDGVEEPDSQPASQQPYLTNVSAYNLPKYNFPIASTTVIALIKNEILGSDSNAMEITDATRANMQAIQTSLTFEECIHKLGK